MGSRRVFKDVKPLGGAKVHILYQCDKEYEQAEPQNELMAIGFEDRLPPNKTLWSNLDEIRAFHSALGKAIQFAEAEQQDEFLSSTKLGGVISGESLDFHSPPECAEEDNYGSPNE